MAAVQDVWALVCSSSRCGDDAEFAFHMSGKIGRAVNKDVSRVEDSDTVHVVVLHMKRASCRSR